MRSVTVYLAGREESQGKGHANKGFAIVCIVQAPAIANNLTLRTMGDIEATVSQWNFTKQ